LIGTVIDNRYEVLEVLGEGGMGTVYRARHAALGRMFAIKALRRDLSQDSDLAARFIQEAKAAAAVTHPSIVQITDFGSLPSGQPYFVMELLGGRALSRIIREEGALPPIRAANIARKVAEALAAAHEVGIIHRDLKPDNVHVATGAGGREIVKVLDFGLAKIAGSSRMTRQGMVFGTPHYMSPEQAAGEPIDHRVDIYALGIVLYEMLTARLPFEADSFMGVLTKHIYMEPVPPSRVVGEEGCLGPLEQFTLRCLEKKPTNRYATMTDLIADLERVVSPSIVPLSPRDPGEPALSGAALDLMPRLPLAPRWQLLLGGAALLLAVVSLGIWAFGSGDRGTGAGSLGSTTAPEALPKRGPPKPTADAPRPMVMPTSAQPAPSPQPRTRPAATTAPTRRSTPAPERSAPRPTKPGTGSEIINPWAE
jgi:serine/threonine-protein kinase